MSSDVRDWVMQLSDIEASTNSTYPRQFQERVRGRIKRRLGKQAGLSRLSVLVAELPPGVATSLRMWQTSEDEFYYVLEGEPTLVTDLGEVRLQPGQSVGFPAGRPVGHHFINRTSRLARVLEVANVAPHGNESVYTEDDLLLVDAPDGKGRIFVNRNRVPYEV
ncbi:MAG: cupin domain-containing protein [Proteobacteria bacterium]|nr:cupin domain-containing protein [Pseudomonadota bacterium]